ncbi:MAG: RNA polymerase subunit sigma [Deltaproteobacteria bacterium]|nr:NAD-dependent deacylase [Deltaproteobacteria bacterium]RLA89390.1 MAG: RNA polymerase subunit sigma [Deltaproteobacteria bacterium]
MIVDQSLIEQAAQDIVNSKKSIAFTGSGISEESGIPTFRGGQGLWEKYDPMEYAHIQSFIKNPEKVWEMLAEMAEIISKAKPNPAHIALAELENMGLLEAVITQNVDGLHQMAGNKHVVEFHGSNQWLVCIKCGFRTEIKNYSPNDFPPKCERCLSILKPDVVFFGEAIPYNAQVKSMYLAKVSDLVLVIGTSAVVYPAAQIPITAKEYGAKIIEINKEKTSLSDGIASYSIEGPAGEVMPHIVEAVRRLIS